MAAAPPEYHPRGPVISLLLVEPIVVALPSGHILARSNGNLGSTDSPLSTSRRNSNIGCSPKKGLQTFAINVAIVRPREPHLRTWRPLA